MTAPLPTRTTAPSLATLTLQGKPLVAAWLDEQQSLSAVERFARKHDEAALPTQAKYYRDLIPLSLPLTGQQFAFDVDLDACTGCKACVAACHNLNGLDETEAFRDVGLLVGGGVDLPVIQHVTTACHHCLEPACLEGCPVLAYEKDEVTGIVKHLDDQCIGCQYCILKCPYDVPKYNASRGIVRKCDMCSDRLKVGEAPACVQACPSQAIRISIVDVDQVNRKADAGEFLVAAPEPGYTKPTTVYRSRQPLPASVLAADHHALMPQHAHPPLVVMLVLTQLSVGAFLVEASLRWFLPASADAAAGSAKLHALVALILGLIALGASTMHLGRPLYAFRAVIGLRTSWLSREIVAFGGFAVMASAYAAANWLLADGEHSVMRQVLRIATISTGLIGVFCSAMIYHDTRRDFWKIQQTGPRFLFTTLWLGSAFTLLMTFGAEGSAWNTMLMVTIAVIGSAKLVFDAMIFRHLHADLHQPRTRTARLMLGPLKRLTMARFVVAMAGGVLLPVCLVLGAVAMNVWVGLALVVCVLAGELMERALFFAAVVAPKMPGGVGGGVR